MDGRKKVRDPFTSIQVHQMARRDDDIRLILKAARELAGMSRENLAEQTHYTSGHIANIENGNRRVTPGVLTVYAAVLGAPLLVDVWEGSEMYRRAVVSALGLVGGLGVTGSVALSEALRLSVLNHFGAAEDWHDVTAQLGRSFMTAPAAKVHDTIGAHLLVLSGQATTSSAHDAAARLMLLRAATTANLGGMAEASSWYRAARKMADTSGDIRLVMFVRGREATRRGYEGATPGEVLELTAGLDYTEAHLARAQAYARLGERNQALSALADAARAYPRTDQSEDTIYGFQPWRYALAEAYVWALLGEVERAEAEASSTALPGSLPRFMAQRDLTRAVALARAGDMAEAQAAAGQVAASHPTEQRSMILTSMLKEAGL